MKGFIGKSEVIYIPYLKTSPSSILFKKYLLIICHPIMASIDSGGADMKYCGEEYDHLDVYPDFINKSTDVRGEILNSLFHH